MTAHLCPPHEAHADLELVYLATQLSPVTKLLSYKGEKLGLFQEFDTHRVKTAQSALIELEEWAHLTCFKHCNRTRKSRE